jgi:hypothetical protein
MIVGVEHCKIGERENCIGKTFRQKIQGSKIKAQGRYRQQAFKMHLYSYPSLRNLWQLCGSAVNFIENRGISKM